MATSARSTLAAEAANRANFWAKVDMLGECWVWTGATGRWGYGKLRYGGHDYSAHRCAYEFTYGPAQKGLFVCHRCDNPPCVNPAHLFLGTAKDNTADMHAKGRAARAGAAGEANRAARLSADDVLQIRNQFAAGVAPKELAAVFGVGSSGINRIIRGSAWSQVGGPISTVDRRGLHNRKAS